MKLEFEWDEAKALKNEKKHGIEFDLATRVFEDAFAIEFLDDRHEDSEERFVVLGMAGDDCVCGIHGARRPDTNLFRAKDDEE